MNYETSSFVLWPQSSFIVVSLSRFLLCTFAVWTHIECFMYVFVCFNGCSVCAYMYY